MPQLMRIPSCQQHEWWKPLKRPREETRGTKIKPYVFSESLNAPPCPPPVFSLSTPINQCCCVCHHGNWTCCISRGVCWGFFSQYRRLLWLQQVSEPAERKISPSRDTNSPLSVKRHTSDSSASYMMRHYITKHSHFTQLIDHYRSQRRVPHSDLHCSAEQMWKRAIEHQTEQ